MVSQRVLAPGPAHPPGRIRLGRDGSKPFDLVQRELASHVFIPGASGSGKTTTLTRLADGALHCGYGVVIVDCKAGSLAGAACALAGRYGLPFTVVDPDRPEVSRGYNPCSGDPASIANKLVGAFTFTGAAEVYKHLAMEVIPVVCRAIAATGEPITLDRLHESLGRGMLAQLGRQAGEPYRTRLATMEQSGGVGNTGYAGLQLRFGALIEGKFGELFRHPDPLRWGDALDRRGVTYLALSATASSEDVELLARVIAQDLKQESARRLRALENGHRLQPVLVVFDEFAAMRSAEEQLVDLLLQARQALLQVVVSTQYLPQDLDVRRACLGAGLIIAHRVEASDAEALAAQFGTHEKWEQTVQYDRQSGASDKGSLRRVDAYNVHPNTLRELRIGQVAVRSVLTGRRAIVTVTPAA